MVQCEGSTYYFKIHVLFRSFANLHRNNTMEFKNIIIFIEARLYVQDTSKNRINLEWINSAINKHLRNKTEIERKIFAKFCVEKQSSYANFINGKKDTNRTIGGCGYGRGFLFYENDKHIIEEWDGYEWNDKCMNWAWHCLLSLTLLHLVLERFSVDTSPILPYW